MGSSSAIRSRILSIKKTQKITNAMYLIASTKLNKAKANLENTRPYFDELKREIKRIFRTTNDIRSRFFYPVDKEPDDSDSTYGILVITADKGLAGQYNQNVIRKTQVLLNEHEDNKLFVVGDYGRRYYELHNIQMEMSFLYTAQNPTLERAREITEIMLQQFEEGEIDKIFVVYTDMSKTSVITTNSVRLLPFHRSFFHTPEKEKKVEVHFELSPSPHEILEGLMRSYLHGFVYSALINSFCSEQKARMEAMNSANENAEELLSDLSLIYNRARQAEITQEITEISAGALAQRR